MTTEAHLVTQIMLMLERRGAYVNKNHGSPFQRMGRPDIEGCLGGRFFALEVKLPGKRRTLTPLQVHALAEIWGAGGFAGVVESVTETEDLLRAWFA